MPDFDTVITLRQRVSGNPPKVTDKKVWARTVSQDTEEVLVDGTTISVASEVRGEWIIASEGRPDAPGNAFIPNFLIDQYGIVFAVAGFAWESAGLWRVTGQYRDDD